MQIKNLNKLSFYIEYDIYSGYESPEIIIGKNNTLLICYGNLCGNIDFNNYLPKYIINLLESKNLIKIQLALNLI